MFGLIFAPDPARAAAELERVVRPGGRIAITAWVERGPIFTVMRATQAAMRPHVPAPPAPSEAEPEAGSHFDWSEPATVTALFPRAAVRSEERVLDFQAASPRAWVEEQLAHHPAWRGVSATLPAGALAALTDELTEILSAANEDPGAMRVCGPYVVHRVDVGGGAGAATRS